MHQRVCPPSRTACSRVGLDPRVAPEAQVSVAKDGLSQEEPRALILSSNGQSLGYLHGATTSSMLLSH